MKVLVTGSTGMVGTALIAELKAAGHHVVRLVRRRRGSGDTEVFWNPAKGELNVVDLEGIEAVVNLAGENIADGRWTPEKKKRIMQSRVQATTLLSETLAKMANPPKVLVSASASGFYGNRPKETLTEVSAAGQGFLPQVCRTWEASTKAAQDKGIRVVHLRIGVVLSRKGGALKAMYWPFQLGLAGNLSLAGKQYMSWITLDDLVAAIIHCLNTESLNGPVNACAPNPVSNATFTDALRRQLIWPIFPMHYWTPPAPAPAVCMLLGEMGKELLLADIRMMPVRLAETGFMFKHPEIKKALSHLF